MPPVPPPPVPTPMLLNVVSGYTRGIAFVQEVYVYQQAIEAAVHDGAGIKGHARILAKAACFTCSRLIYALHGNLPQSNCFQHPCYKIYRPSFCNQATV